MTARALYERLLGADFARLPAAVQRFHRLQGHTVLYGEVRTEAPRTALARLLALGLGTPRRASAGRIRFELTPDAAGETWTRHFPAHTMRSRLCQGDDCIVERLGAARLRFRLHASEDRLSMRLVALAFLGLPCPRWLLPQVVAEERGDGERLHFFIRATLPWIGPVAAYRGHLVVPPPEAV